MTTVDPSATAGRVVAAALHDFLETDHRGVVVDSPPGAGKSTLVVCASTEMAASGEAVMVVAQTNAQVDDLIDRMARHAPGVTIGRLDGTDYVPDCRIAHPNVTHSRKLDELGRPQITIATAKKWSYVKDVSWRRAIIDEAYQMRSDALLQVASRFDEALFVGDPGQLDPFSTMELDRWVGLPWDPMQSAVAAMQRSNPELPVHQLPVSWRLSAEAAPVVSTAFYPFTPFDAGTGPGQRQMGFTTRPLRRGAVDDTLEMAATTGWALHELPRQHTMRTDADAVEEIVTIALRLLERGTVVTSAPDHVEQPVTADRIAIGAAHRDQVAAIERELTARGGAGITVDTANRLQGAEFDVVIVLHPLSGRRDATAFHLESGRLCVLTSRHRHACIVVARAGIQELLDAHPTSEPMHIDVPAKFPDGWAANHSMLEHLRRHRNPAA
ncbi:AAA domain-containing protein [Actinokineospora globicatena]|uniref:AAA domain-containing protein n=1 Tax=Actinokineospora globicatena TaxID=103729 RepID=UPI0020A280FE|nr:AAA family ATPase [Actinokineospora globicatena]MCP2302960.1 AAA domain-containing protein [Actinokineospora globicatena]GLW78651.1 helicase [Actinokineospora globicatena]GLW84681.1 helicase [Actinokineospora globicatena]